MFMWPVWWLKLICDKPHTSVPSKEGPVWNLSLSNRRTYLFYLMHVCLHFSLIQDAVLQVSYNLDWYTNYKKKIENSLPPLSLNKQKKFFLFLFLLNWVGLNFLPVMQHTLNKISPTNTVFVCLSTNTSPRPNLTLNSPTISLPLPGLSSVSAVFVSSALSISPLLWSPLVESTDFMLTLSHVAVMFLGFKLQSLVELTSLSLLCLSLRLQSVVTIAPLQSEPTSKKDYNPR